MTRDVFAQITGGEGKDPIQPLTLTAYIKITIYREITISVSDNGSSFLSKPSIWIQTFIL